MYQKLALWMSSSLECRENSSSSSRDVANWQLDAVVINVIE